VHLPEGSAVSTAGSGWTINGDTLHMQVVLTRDFSTRIVF
jgi:hypothetical protein